MAECIRIICWTLSITEGLKTSSSGPDELVIKNWDLKSFRDGISRHSFENLKISNGARGMTSNDYKPDSLGQLDGDDAKELLELPSKD